jgi:F-type H+-transporting ATPase subunit b
MDATIHALGRILLNSVPTFLLVLFLVLYLRAIFFGPLTRILERRYEETEGARKAAQESMRQADLRISEYEEKLRAARGQLYAEQSRFLKQIELENARQIEQARRESESQLAKATGELRAEAGDARAQLDARSAELADRIVSRILEGRAA